MAQEIIIQATTEADTESTRRALSSIRARVLRNLGGDAEYFTEDDIDTYIQQAFDDLAENSKVYDWSSTDTTVSGTRLYDKPSNVINIDALTYDNVSLRKQEKADILKMYDNGNTPELALGSPTSWCVWNLTQICLYPTPNEAKTIEFHYKGYMDDLTDDTDESELLKTADVVAENYATMMLWPRDREAGQYQIYRGLWQQARAKLILNQINEPQYMSTEDYYHDILDGEESR